MAGWEGVRVEKEGGWGVRLGEGALWVQADWLGKYLAKVPNKQTERERRTERETEDRVLSTSR